MITELRRLAADLIKEDREDRPIYQRQNDHRVADRSQGWRIDENSIIALPQVRNHLLKTLTI